MEHPSASKAEPPATPHSLSSRVDIGHFDPEGVLALKETLSRQSRDQVELSRATTRTATDTTLGDANGFDFEKTLRNKILRYVVPPPVRSLCLIGYVLACATRAFRLANWA